MDRRSPLVFGLNMKTTLKPFIIMSIFLGILGNGFQGAVPLFGGIAQASEESHGGGEGGKEGAPAGPIFVKMDPLVVPLVNGDGVSQIVSLIVTFEVATPEGASKIESLKPRVKDAMIVNLYGMLTERAAMDKGVLRTDYLKKRLLEAVENVVGKDVLKDVLLQMVQQNPM